MCVPAVAITRDFCARFLGDLDRDAQAQPVIATSPEAGHRTGIGCANKFTR